MKFIYYAMGTLLYCANWSTFQPYKWPIHMFQCQFWYFAVKWLHLVCFNVSVNFNLCLVTALLTPYKRLVVERQLSFVYNHVSSYFKVLYVMTRFTLGLKGGPICTVHVYSTHYITGLFKVFFLENFKVICQ